MRAGDAAPPAPPAVPPEQEDDDDLVSAVPLRRPGRWIAAAILLVLLGLFLYGAATNPDYQWSTYRDYLFDQRIADAALVTLELTVLSMLIGIVLGMTIAIMRMSDNFVLRWVAWLYVWIFRGTPVYVQLVFWGLGHNAVQSDRSRGAVHEAVRPPADRVLAHPVRSGVRRPRPQRSRLHVRDHAGGNRFGRRGPARGVDRSGHDLMAEHPPHRVAAGHAVRHSADRQPGHRHAEDDVSGDCRTADGRRLLQVRGDRRSPLPPDPLLLVASTWYLAMTSVLMIGQHFLEKRYSRGASRVLTAKQLQALAHAQASPGPGRVSP